MSVLFQALNRAAREHRDQPSSLAIPFILPPSRTAWPRWVWLATIAALVLFAGTGLNILWRSFAGFDYAVSLAVDDRLPVTPPVAVGREGDGAEPSAPVSRVPDQPLPPPPAVEAPNPPPVPVSSLSDGILLPVDSKAVPSFEDKTPIETAAIVPDASPEVLPQQVEKPEKETRPAVTVKTEAPSPARLLKEAHDSIKTRDYEKAKSLFNKVLAQDGNDQAAWDGKLFVLQQSGTADAKTELQAMAVARPFSAPVQFALAQTAMRLGDQQTTLEALKRAVALEGGNRQYLLSLAVLHDQMGHAAEALETYRKIPPPVTPDVQLRLDYLALQTPPKSSP